MGFSQETLTKIFRDSKGLLIRGDEIVFGAKLMLFSMPISIGWSGEIENKIMEN